MRVQVTKVTTHFPARWEIGHVGEPAEDLFPTRNLLSTGNVHSSGEFRIQE